MASTSRAASSASLLASTAASEETLGVCASRHFEVKVVQEPHGALSTRIMPDSSAPECPITGEAMRKPVMTCDGHVYEEDAIKRWFEQGRRTSPLTNLELLNTNLQPLQDFTGSVEAFLSRRPEVK